jgi:transposase
MRLLLDGVPDVLRIGCAWRRLPLDFPPWQTVLRWFLRLARCGAFERMAHALAVAKRVVGRKRHALVGTDGRLLLAAVSPADLHDSHGGLALLQVSRRPWPFALCYADRADAGPPVAEATPITVELVGPMPGQRGFAVQARRWVIKRTFAWTSRCRRLVRDHKATANSAIAFFVLAAAAVLLRRLAKPI